jgi:aprataxin
MRPVAHPKSFPSTWLPQLTHLVKSISATTQNPKKATSEARSRGVFLPYPPNLDPPAKIVSQCLYRSDKCAVVNDAFPKSNIHMLVLPLDVKIQSLNDLNRLSGHVELLVHMKETATRYVNHFRELEGRQQEVSAYDSEGVSPSPSSCPKTPPPMLWSRPFIMGFHAIPSLPMLHMHCMTLDLASPRIKKRAHYNAFATRFFLPVDEVIRDLSANGHVTLNQDVERLMAYEKQPYACLWCGQNSESFSQLPVLMKHVATCPLNRAASAVVVS